MNWGAIATWPFSLESIKEAAQMLEGGENVLDTIVHAVSMVEKDLEVDSVGLGGFPNAQGEVELDAGIMDGDTLNVGGVGGLKGYVDALLLARIVMDQTKHSLIVGEGAAALAKAHGLAPMNLLTDEALAKWKEVKNKTEPIGHDTVGMVALQGTHIAAGTSTSGMGMKMAGRVGDSPMVGNGFYADSNVGGAAATGLGEEIMKGCTCFYAVQKMSEGVLPQQAAEQAVLYTHNLIASRGRSPGNIALVCMNTEGEFGAAANHSSFSYTAANANQSAKLYKVYPVVQRESSQTPPELLSSIAPKQSLPEQSY